MRPVTLAILAAATMLFARAAIAQQNIDFSKVEIKTTDLGNGAYMLQGQGGNITVAVGDDGIIMVDSEFAPLSNKIESAITKISPLPIRYLVNTSFHTAHTGGNEFFRIAGATVVAQSDVRLRLERGSVNAVTGAKTPPMSEGAMPTYTYNTNSRLLQLSGQRALLSHTPAAATDGDTWIYLPEANVLATGDTFTNTGRYPAIDVANGGNIDGMISAVDTFLRLSNERTKVIPGHGELATKARMAEFYNMLVISRDRMKSFVDSGRNEQDVLTTDLFADLDQKWAGNNESRKNWKLGVYRSLRQSYTQSYTEIASYDPRTFDVDPQSAAN
jgi:cyclase